MAKTDDSNIILIHELDNTKKLISMNNIITSTDNDISLFNINKSSLNKEFYDTYLKVLYVHLVLLLNKSSNSKINIQNIDDLELFMIYLIFLAIFNLSNLKLITYEYLIKTKDLLKTKYDNFKIKNRILNLIIDKFITNQFHAINLNSLKQNLNLSEFLQDFDKYKEKPDDKTVTDATPRSPSPRSRSPPSRPPSRPPSPPSRTDLPLPQSDSPPQSPRLPPSPSRSQSDSPPLEISSLPTGLSPSPRSESQPPPLSSNSITVTEWLFNNTIFVNANEGNIRVPSNDRYIQTKYKKFGDKYYFNYEGATPPGVYVVQKPDNFDGDTNQIFGNSFSFIIDNEEIINLQEKKLKYVKFTFKDTETNNPPFEKPFFNLTLYFNDGTDTDNILKNYYFSDFTENDVDISETIKTIKKKEIRDSFCSFFSLFNQLLKKKYPYNNFDYSPCYENWEQAYAGGGGGDVNYINLISINIINKLILGKQTEIESFISEFKNFNDANIIDKGKDK